jgi:hypothetical protein
MPIGLSFKRLQEEKGALLEIGAQEGKTVGQALHLGGRHPKQCRLKPSETWRDYYGVAGSAPNPLNVTIK